MENNDVVVKVSSENMANLFDALAKSAFDSLKQGKTAWGIYESNNPFYNVVKEVFRENKEEIKKELSDILMDIVKGDEFRNAVRVEYTALLAESMISKIQNSR